MNIKHCGNHKFLWERGREGERGRGRERGREKEREGVDHLYWSHMSLGLIKKGFEIA